jgi:hypothetical protein
MYTKPNRRKINTSNITGMDLRDDSLDQNAVKEIINLKKENNGWSIRGSRKDLLTLDNSSDNPSDLFVFDETAVLKVNNSLIYYKYEDDELTDKLNTYTLPFEFDAFQTQYPFAFIIKDKTNGRNYIMEISEKICTLTDDVGSVDLSSEYLCSVIDSITKDQEHAFMCKRTTDYTAESSTWEDSIDKYSILYSDGSGFKKATLISMMRPDTQQTKIIIVTSDGTDSYVYTFDWDDNNPTTYTSRYAIENSGSSVDILSNTYGRFADCRPLFEDYGEYIMSSGQFPDVTHLISTDNGLYIYTVPGDGNSYLWKYVSEDSWKKIYTYNGENTYNSYTTDSNYIYLNEDDVLVKISINNDTRSVVATAPSTIYSMAILGDNIYVSRKGTFTYSIDKSILNGSLSNWSLVGSPLHSGHLRTINIDGTDVLHSFNDEESHGTGSQLNIYRYSGDGILWSTLGTINEQGDSTAFVDDVYFKQAVSISGANSSWLNVMLETGSTNNQFVFFYSETLTDWTDISSAAGDSAALYDGGDMYVFRGRLLIAGQSALNTPAILYGDGAGGWTAIYGTQNDQGIFINQITSHNEKLYTSGNKSATEDFISNASLKYSDKFELYIPTGVNSFAYKVEIDESQASGTAFDYSTVSVGGTNYGMKCMVFLWADAVYYNNAIIDNSASNSYISIDINSSYNGNISSVNFSTAKTAIANFHLPIYAFDVQLNKNYDDSERCWSIVSLDQNGVIRTSNLIIDGDASTSSYENNGDGVYISELDLSNATFLSIAKIGSISDNDFKHNIYIIDGKKAYSIPITGNKITSEDVSNLSTYYNFELNQFGDYDGNIIGLSIFNSLGYTLTEINKSKKPFIRPYFTPDSSSYSTTGDTVTVNKSVTNDCDMTEETNVIDITGSGETTHNIGVGWGVADNTGSYTYIPEGAKVSKIVSSTQFEIDDTIVADASAETVTFTAPTDDFEVFAQMQMLTANQNYSYRTPITIGDGADVLAMDDSGTYLHRYWLINIPKSGFYDNSNVSAINIARSEQIDGAYDLIYWNTDLNYLSTYSDLLGFDENERLPQPFSNIAINSQPAPSLQDGDNYRYVINDTIFYKIGGQVKDRFNARTYFEQFESTKFKIQDMTWQSGHGLYCDFENKSTYFDTGLKYVNRYNALQHDDNPTAITNMSNSGVMIMCEQYIYQYVINDIPSGGIIMSNMGLEKGNWRSLVSDQENIFFFNKEGIYHISPQGFIRIHKPIEDYLTKRNSGNLLGIDPLRNLLYVDLNYSQIDDLKVELQTGDYGVASDTTTEYGRMYGVFDYKNGKWRIYAYESTNDTEYSSMFATIKENAIIKVEDKLVIPEYLDEDGTENPICRFRTKRMTFSNVHGRHKIRAVLYDFVNSGTYGIDYVRTNLNLNESTNRADKYGDFDGADYTDTTNGFANTSDSGYNSTTGISRLKQGYRQDFNSIMVTAEFARLLDTNYADVGFASLMVDYIDKSIERKGVR